MRFSLDWGLHWLLGFGAGAAMSWIFVRRFGSGEAASALLVTGLLGFFLGQVVEPALEAIAEDVSFGAVSPRLRWSIFAAFAVAWLSGAGIGLVVALRRGRIQRIRPNEAD